MGYTIFLLWLLELLVLLMIVGCLKLISDVFIIFQDAPTSSSDDEWGVKLPHGPTRPTNLELPTPNNVVVNNNEIVLNIQMARALADAWQACDV